MTYASYRTGKIYPQETLMRRGPEGAGRPTSRVATGESSWFRELCTEMNWIHAIRGKEQATCPSEHAVPPYSTETMLPRRR